MAAMKKFLLPLFNSNNELLELGTCNLSWI